MITFFMDGGWAMWPVLAVGLVLLIAAIRFAIDRERVHLRLITMLSMSILALAVQGTLLDAAKVLWVLSDEAKIPQPMIVRVFFEGMKESLSPMIFGLGFLSLSLLAVSVGVYRSGRRELAALSGA
jgi:hypothetical protein